MMLIHLFAQSTVVFLPSFTHFLKDNTVHLDIVFDVNIVFDLNILSDLNILFHFNIVVDLNNIFDLNNSFDPSQLSPFAKNNFLDSLKRQYLLHLLIQNISFTSCFYDFLSHGVVFAVSNTQVLMFP